MSQNSGPNYTGQIAPEAKVTQCLRLAIWFGLLAGLGETAMRGSAKLLLSRVIYFDLGSAWMVPVSNAVLYSISILILLLLSWGIRRKGPSFRSVIFLLALLSASSLLLLMPRLHILAKLAIGVGLAVNMVRLFNPRAIMFLRLVRGTTVYLIGICLGSTLLIFGWQSISERNKLAKLPPASPNAPNVLLITMDTVRAENMSLYGYSKRTTPQLEELSKSGVNFKQAFAPAPWTLASHASMFTGRLPNELSIGWDKPLVATFPTLAEILAKHGYATAGFVANPAYCGHEFGLSRGFVHYEVYPTSPGQIFISSSLGQAIASAEWLRNIINYYEIPGRKTADQVNNDFVHWLSRNNQRPFFAFLNYFDAHCPYLPPAPFDSMFGQPQKRKNPLLPTDEEYLPPDVAAEITAYDGAIAYMDHSLGSLIKELERLGLRDKTLIIVTSDHGEEFNEHGLMGHGNSLYLPSLHVPLLISLPSVTPENKTISEPVSLSDIHSTVVDLLKLGLDDNSPRRSLRRYWDASLEKDGTNSQILCDVPYAPNLPEHYPVSKGDMKSFVMGRYHYIINGDGRRELYDFARDPLEKHDLIGLPESVEILQQFGVPAVTAAGNDPKVSERRF